jgi:hypothetical protein
VSTAPSVVIRESERLMMWVAWTTGGQWLKTVERRECVLPPFKPPARVADPPPDRITRIYFHFRRTRRICF